MSRSMMWTKVIVGSSVLMGFGWWMRVNLTGPDNIADFLETVPEERRAMYERTITEANKNNVYVMEAIHEAAVTNKKPIYRQNATERDRENRRWQRIASEREEQQEREAQEKTE